MHPEKCSNAPDESENTEPTETNLSRYLHLQKQQIDAANKFAEQPVDRAVDCLIELCGRVQELSHAIDLHEAERPGRRSVRELCNIAIESLQFADEQTQRLDHVSWSLDCLSKMSRSGIDPDQMSWMDVEAETRSFYSTEAERAIHARIYDPELAGSGETT